MGSRRYRAQTWIRLQVWQADLPCPRVVISAVMIPFRVTQRSLSTITELILEKNKKIATGRVSLAIIGGRLVSTVMVFLCSEQSYTVSKTK